MEPSWILSLWEGATVSTGEPGELTLLGRKSRLRLHKLSAGCLDALRRLAASGESVAALTETVWAADGPVALPRWYYYLQELARRRFLRIGVHSGADRLALLVPTAAGFVLAPGGFRTQIPLVLSRFACLRRLGDTLVLESPLSCARILLQDVRATALVHLLARPLLITEMVERLPALSSEVVTALLALLSCAGMVTALAEKETTAEDADPNLLSWEFHDLLFHARSRVGRHDAPVGALYPMMDRLEPPLAVKPPLAVETTDLYRPDLEQLTRQDPPFAWVQEQRQSLREYASEPITDRQLGEFLYRVARVTKQSEQEVMTPHGPICMEFAARPYPGGGGLYEMEVYVVVNACQGLSAGLYHYDAARHRLERLCERTAEVELLLRDVAPAVGSAPETLQVLLILASRFPRLAWKYSTLAYALTLKHVGVLYQTMYLAATAMGLAPCAVGSGDADLFARATGLHYYAEGSVGEFLLGSKRERSALRTV